MGNVLLAAGASAATLVFPPNFRIRDAAYRFLGSKALELLIRAERLSPRDPRGWFIPRRLKRRYQEAEIAAQKALDQNPRYTVSLWLLAASLVKQGRTDEAREAIREVLVVERQLTLTKLRERMMFIQERLWQEASAALRLAGLPE
jgi:adenylate cyclase